MYIRFTVKVVSANNSSIHNFCYSFLACNEGFYGRNCSEVCSPNCMICRHTDGLCACKAGWSGPRCTEGDYFRSLILLGATLSVPVII